MHSKLSTNKIFIKNMRGSANLKLTEATSSKSSAEECINQNTKDSADLKLTEATSSKSLVEECINQNTKNFVDLKLTEATSSKSLVDEDTKKKLRDPADIKFKSSHLGDLIELGIIIEDFAKKNFRLILKNNKKDVYKLRKAYTDFFVDPLPHKKYASEMMKFGIAQLCGITNVEEIVDKLIAIYLFFCHFIKNYSISKIVENKDYDAIELLFNKAPPPENYHQELHRIFLIYLKK